MLLLLGGLFTALYSSEGYMDLSEGQSSAIVSDYHDREFVILNDKTNEIIQRYDHKELSAEQVLSFGEITTQLKILEYCQNCEIVARPEEEKSPARRGMAQHMKLVSQ